MHFLTSCEIKHFESHCPAKPEKPRTFSAFILLLRGKDSFWLDRDNNFGSVAIAESWILRLGNILHYFWHCQGCFGSLKLTLDAWCHFWWALILLFAKKSHKRDSLRWPEFAIIAKFLKIDLWFGFLEHVFKLPLNKNDCTAYDQEVDTRPVHQFIESLDNQN